MKTQLNLTEVLADEDVEQAFDQPCKFENRLGFHGTYCHHPVHGGGKCPWRFCGPKWHAECEWFEANPNDKSKWEEKDD